MKNFLLIVMLSSFCLKSYADIQDVIYTCPNIVICKNNQCKNGLYYNNVWRYMVGFHEAPDNNQLNQRLYYPYQFKNDIYIFEKVWASSGNSNTPVTCFYKGSRMPLTLSPLIYLRAYGDGKWDQGGCGYCYSRGDSSYCTMKAGRIPG